MSDSPHDHAHPDVSAQRAVLATARAVLAADPDAAHDAAGTGSCEACTVVSACQLAFALAAELTGTRFVSGPLHRRLLDAITSAEAELRGTAN
jgi:hypothetical protein